jgi:hypothetical protein
VLRRGERDSSRRKNLRNTWLRRMTMTSRLATPRCVQLLHVSFKKCEDYVNLRSKISDLFAGQFESCNVVWYYYSCGLFMFLAFFYHHKLFRKHLIFPWDTVTEEARAATDHCVLHHIPCLLLGIFDKLSAWTSFLLYVIHHMLYCSLCS